MSLISDLRLDIGDDGISASGTTTTQLAGNSQVSSLLDLRVDIGDDTGILVSPALFIYAASGVVDNAVVRWDGATGQYVQNSSVTIDDNGNITFAGILNALYKGRTLSGPGNYTLSNTDNLILLAKTISQATTIGLPPSPASGALIIIKDAKGDASTFPITITSSQLIDGLSNVTISQNFSSYTFYYNGSTWNLI